MRSIGGKRHKVMDDMSIGMDQTKPVRRVESDDGGDEDNSHSSGFT